MDISPIELKSETDFERGFKYKTYIIDVKKKSIILIMGFYVERFKINHQIFSKMNNLSLKILINISHVKHPSNVSLSYFE